MTRADTAPIHACNPSAGTPAGLPHLCRTAGFAQLPAEPYQRVQQIVPLALVSPLTLTDTVVVNARIDMIDHDAREQGPNPGVTLSRQQTARLTIVSVDPKGPSVTVLTQDGRRLSFRPFQQKDVDRLEIGDQMDVTYTQALVISVLPATALPHELATTAARPVIP